LTGPHYASSTSNDILGGPNAWTISNIVASGSQAETANSTGESAWGYVFGQFVDHDLDLTKGTGADAGITVPAGNPKLPAGSEIPMPRADTDRPTVQNGFVDAFQS
jgi:hypothetical protein